MDAVIIVIMGLVFCLISQSANSATSQLEAVIEQQQTEVAGLEVKTNDDFYEDPHAFEVIAHGLNFC